MRTARQSRRRSERRRRLGGQTRLLLLQSALLAGCLLLGAVWAWQDWHRERAATATLAALSGAPVADPWAAWLHRNGPLFALGAALLLLVINADLQGTHRLRRLERERRRALHDALHDALTRLPNRRAFDRRLRRLAVERTDAASLLLVDLDGFKEINDTLGHEAGDLALVRVAATLRESVCRDGGLCCRWGGDEFAVLLPRADRATAERTAARLEQALQQLVIVRDGHAFHVSGSIGIATLRDDSSYGQDDLFRIADEVLAGVKRQRHSRRNDVVTDDEVPEVPYVRRRTQVQTIR